jgi:predicted NUDIX family phosphoesterase
LQTFCQSSREESAEVTNSHMERVLVVPTEIFHGLGHFQGFSSDVDRYLPELLNPKNTSFRPRHEVEEDPGFKQLIPYVILRHQHPAQGTTVFEYTRGKGQGEGRLHSKRSVGIGGHISAQDAELAGSGVYHEGMRRELAEEIHLGSEYTERCVGLINDDLTEVGRVHLGVVHIFDLVRPDVAARECDILCCGFRPVAEVISDLQGMETWSQICLQALFARG